MLKFLKTKLKDSENSKLGHVIYKLKAKSVFFDIQLSEFIFNLTGLSSEIPPNKILRLLLIGSQLLLRKALTIQLVLDHQRENMG